MDAEPKTGVHASPDEIRSLAFAIATFSTTSGFERRLRIGELVWQRVVANRLGRGELGARHTQLTLRRLCKALNNSISKSDLHRCVSTLHVCQALPFVSASRHLTVGHVDAVAGLPLPVQSELLRSAEAHRWSCRQLRQVRRKCLLPSSGRPEPRTAALSTEKLPAVVRMTHQLAGVCARLRYELEHGLEQRDLTELFQCLSTVSNACHDVRRRLGVLPIRAGLLHE